MKIFKKRKCNKLFIVFVPLVVFMYVLLLTPSKVFAATTRVDLLTVDNFAVLSGIGLSDTVTTSVIVGDVGLNPGGGASITGLTCAEITGTLYDNDGGYTGNGGGSTACRQTNPGLLTSAQNSLTTAYTDAANRSTTATIATDLAGAVLTDGVYDSSAGTFSITGGGTLTLNGQGNADSVFIFKMASTLITSSASQVVLTNGAQACNVYWQVGSAATLGTGSTLIGNVMALSAITDNGGSTVNGRLLARTGGALTLNNTHVTRQTCNSTSSSLSSSGAPSSFCPALPASIVPPIVLSSRRIDADSVFISWGPFSGTDTFNVSYGLANGNWLYNTNVTGFSTTINDLPDNTPIWVRVAARNSCTIGTYGQVKLVGGPALPNSGINPNSPMQSLVLFIKKFINSFFVLTLS